MSKKQVLTYTYVTFLKQDVKELIDLFQTNLQDVDIFIDDLPILESSQLEQFEAPYQATSLLARGYLSDMVDTVGDDGDGQREHQLVELKMGRRSAVLVSWKDVGEVEPEVLVQVKKLLLLRRNRVHQLVVFFATICLFTVASPLPPLVDRYNFDFPTLILLEVTGTLFLMSVALFLYYVIISFFKLDTRIFLFPGATQAKRNYGRREAISTAIVVFLILVLVTLMVIFAYRTFVSISSYNQGYNQRGLSDQATATAQAKKIRPTPTP